MVSSLDHEKSNALSPPTSPEGRSGTDRPLRLRPLTWEWIAAFFDGEGAISVHARKYVVEFELSITQVSEQVLRDILSFFKKEGAESGAIYSERSRINRLVLYRKADIVTALTGMLPFLRVKQRQAAATLDYLQERLTGTHYVQILNEEHLARRKGRKVHYADQPWTHEDGLSLMRKATLASAHGGYLRKSQIIARAVAETNRRRGETTRQLILAELARGPKSLEGLNVSILRSESHTRRLLRDMSRSGLVLKARGEGGQCIYIAT